MGIFVPRKKEFWQRKPSGLVELGNIYGPEDFTNAYIFNSSGPWPLHRNDIVSESGISYTDDGAVVNGNDYSEITTDKNVDLSPGEGTWILRAAKGFSTGNIQEGIFCDKLFSRWSIDEGISCNIRGDGGLAFQINHTQTRTGINHFLDAEPHDVIINWKLGEQGDIYIDGSEITYDARPTPTAAIDSISGLRIGAYYADSGGTRSAITISYLYSFRRRLDLDEALSISEAPYQILKPRRSYWLMPTGGGLLNVDRALDIESLSSVDSHAGTPLEVSAEVDKPSLLVLENLSGLRVDPIVPAEHQVSVRADENLQPDWLGSVLIDRHAPFDTLSNARSDRTLHTEHSSSLRSEKIMPVDYLSLVASTQFLPLEWLGQALFVADRMLPISWSTSLQTDDSIPLDNLAQINLSSALPVSFLASALADRSAPISHLFSVQANRSAPAEWAGSLVVNSDHPVPIEWRGGVLVNADHTLPLSWLTDIEVDHTLAPGSLLTVVAHEPVPVGFNAGLVADQTAVISWLESVGVSRQALFESRGAVIVNADQVVPIEWAGVSGFVAGNLHVFNVDKRGHVWHVPSRGKRWN